MALITAAVLAGCGGPEAPKFPVSKIGGTLTLDGQPIEKGTIVFSPQGGAGGPVTVDVAAGKFLSEAVPQGKHIVVFNAMKETGKMNTEYSTPFPELVNLIPKKYQTGVEFDASGDQLDVKFELTTK